MKAKFNSKNLSLEFNGDFPFPEDDLVSEKTIDGTWSFIGDGDFNGPAAIDEAEEALKEKLGFDISIYLFDEFGRITQDNTTRGQFLILMHRS